VPTHCGATRGFLLLTKIFKIIIRLGFTFKKFLKLKFYRGTIFHGSSDKNQQKPRRAGGLGTSSNQLCINSVIDSNICDHGGIYKTHELSDPHSETQLLRDHRQVDRRHMRSDLTMMLYGVPSDIARNILDITFHT
jgi:hypothetical protein